MAEGGLEDHCGAKHLQGVQAKHGEVNDHLPHACAVLPEAWP